MTDYSYAKEVRINRAEDYAVNKYDGIMQGQFKRLKNLLYRRMKINIGSTVIAVAQTVLMYLYFSYMAFSGRISISEYTVLLGSTTLFVSLILGFFEKIALFGRTLKVLDCYFEYRGHTHRRKQYSREQRTATQGYRLLAPDNTV